MTSGQLKQMLLAAGFRDAAHIDQYVRVLDGPPGPGNAAKAAEYAGTWGDVALVVIDNLGKFGPRWLPGFKENDNTDANRFIDLCSGFKMHGACVAIMANTSYKSAANDAKVKYTRGATGFGDAADQVYYMAKASPWGESTPGYSEIYCIKVRFGGSAENDYLGRFGFDDKGGYYTKAAADVASAGTLADFSAQGRPAKVTRATFMYQQWQGWDVTGHGFMSRELSLLLAGADIAGQTPGWLSCCAVWGASWVGSSGREGTAGTSRAAPALTTADGQAGALTGTAADAGQLAPLP